MREAITQRLVDSLTKRAKAGDLPKPIEARDPSLKNFILRVQPSGRASYIVQVGRGKRITIGDAALQTPATARARAKIALGAVADGRDPRAALKLEEGARAPTLSDYLTDTYGPWLEANRKTGAALVARIKTCFSRDFGDTRLDAITAWNIEKWRKARLQAGRTPATINRDLSALKSALTRAVEWGLLGNNPLASIKPAKVDSGGIVRYLSADEEARLRKALADRDADKRAARANANQWRRKRAKPELANLDRYADHLTPMVLLSLNTGVRRGELFNLKWADVDLERGNLTVQGAGAKSGKTRHIPLNAEAAAALRQWRKQTPADAALVFSGRHGARVDNIKKAWAALLKAAGIAAFRWHDLRHSFASKLVMAGVDLNTVRELLGHSDLTMTLRYAHLAPEHKAAAVARLVEVR